MMRTVELKAHFPGQYFSPRLFKGHCFKPCYDVLLAASDSTNHLSTRRIQEAIAEDIEHPYDQVFPVTKEAA